MIEPIKYFKFYCDHCYEEKDKDDGVLVIAEEIKIKAIEQARKEGWLVTAEFNTYCPACKKIRKYIGV